MAQPRGRFSSLSMNGSLLQQEPGHDRKTLGFTWFARIISERSYVTIITLSADKKDLYFVM